MRLFCSCDSDHRLVQQRVDDLSKTVEGLKRERTSLLQEFAEQQDKVFRWMQRTEKRARDARNQEQAPPHGEPSPGPATPALARAVETNPAVARILARRGWRRNGVPAPVPDEG